MSTTALLPGPTTSAKELVRQLSDEQKNAVLMMLVEQLFDVRGANAAIPLTNPIGKHLGFLVPLNAASKLFKVVPSVLTPEQRRKTEEALANLDATFDVGEYIKELNREVTQG